MCKEFNIELRWYVLLHGGQLSCPNAEWVMSQRSNPENDKASKEKVKRVKLLLRHGADPSMKREPHRNVFTVLADKIDGMTEEEKEPDWEIMRILTYTCI